VSTLKFRQDTAPNGAGYCTTAALGSDNPGYDVKADPAPAFVKSIGPLAAAGSRDHGTLLGRGWGSCAIR
jgi:hypothetical protein